MADLGLPDTLTPEQAQRLGFIKKPQGKVDMPDTLSPEQAKRMGLSGGAPAGAPVDVADLARREQHGYTGPRDLTDEQAGTLSGPIKTVAGQLPFTPMRIGARTEQAPAPADSGIADTNGQIESVTRYPGSGFGILNLQGPPKTVSSRLDQGEMTDPLVQIGAAGAIGQAAGAGAGMLATGARLPNLATAIAPAVEGGTANKALGGDFSTGAALAGILPALRATKGVASDIQAAAPARVAAKVQTNLGEDVPKRTGDKITAVAKKGDLNAVVDRNPELRHALAVQAENKPAAALETVQKTKAAANEARNADFERMQEHFADKPASGQASIAGVLDDYGALLKTSLGDRERQAVLKAARKEITDFGDDLRKAQGLPPAVDGDYSGTVISPKDLRDLEQTIGTRAYEGVPVQNQTSVKRRVNAELYKPLARQMNSLAEATPGVDAEKFANTGKDIHVLIPVEEALQIKVDRAANGKLTLRQIAENTAHGLSHVAGLTGGYMAHGATGAITGALLPAVGRGAYKLGARGLRGLDYRLAESLPLSPISPSTSAPLRLLEPAGQAAAIGQGATGDRTFAQKVTEAMGRGLTLQEAVAGAGGD